MTSPTIWSSVGRQVNSPSVSGAPQLYRSTASSRLRVAQLFIMQIGHRSMADLTDLLVTAVAFKATGQSVLAGYSSGRDAVLEHFESLARRTAGTFDIIKWNDWMIGDSHVAVLLNVHAQCLGRFRRESQLVLVKLNARDRIVEIRVFVGDRW
jgi:hypothetical protein